MNDQYFQVALRVRKLLQNEDAVAWATKNNALHSLNVSNMDFALAMDSKDRKRIMAIEQMESQNFQFDYIEDDQKTQGLYIKLCRNLVKQTLAGYHATIMCYGQTTSGKTYTTLGTHDNPGILPCSLRDVFSSKGDTKIWIQYIQVYNEQLDDLLSEQSVKITIIDDPQWGTQLQGAKRVRVKTFQTAIDLLNEGEQRRIYRATKIHDHSSRSHTVFKIYIENVSNTKVTFSCLNLIDLAGSERLSETDSLSQSETGYINKSLFTLTNVINKLADKQKHIPFRDSKLTRLLKDSLGGNTFTLLICCISPAKKNFLQTLSTLKFANRAKLIRNAPELQVLVDADDPRDKEILDLRQQVKRLNDVITQMKNNPPPSVVQICKNCLELENQLKEVKESRALKVLEINQLPQQAKGTNQPPSQCIQILNRDQPSSIEQSFITKSKGTTKQEKQSYNSASTNNISVCAFQVPSQEGTLLVWGSNQDGRIGLGEDVAIAKTPTQLCELAQVACGSHHTLGLNSKGQILVWGRGQKGQLGLESTANVSTPRILQLKDTIIQVACGWQHSLALDMFGRILSWGYGEDGQLGHGDCATYLSPVVIKNHTAQQIYAGHSHSAFITDSDELYTFGSNWDGRCMLNDLGTVPSPQLSIRDRIISVSLGVSHMGVVLNSGQLIMAGTGTEGQLGMQLDENAQETIILERLSEEMGEGDEQMTYEQELATSGVVVQRFQNGGCKQVACGDRYTLVLTQQGKVYTFGKSTYCRLGFKAKENTFEPTPIMQDVVSVSAGCRHSAAITKQNDLFMWGFNFHNQLGLGLNDKDQEWYQILEIQALSKFLYRERSARFHWGIFIQPWSQLSRIDRF